MRVSIVDYGSGNLHSAANAFQRAARDGGTGAKIEVTSDPQRAASADRIVLPGVGAYADCRRGLDGVAGMVEALTEAVIEKARPFLGICVGMQLLSTRGLEKTTTLGLDWIGGDVREIEPRDSKLKIPQIGWNTIHVKQEHPLFDGIRTGEGGLHAYFVHSYHLLPNDPSHVLATTDYGGSIIAAIGRDNIAGTQFHPEKSQALGQALIANFLKWKP